MKKVRLIIAVVAVALMVMGVGYAAWGYTLPVDVKGDLYTFHPVLNSVVFDDGGSGHYVNYTIEPDQLSATITTAKLYPGCPTYPYLIEVKNLSTDMSARLTGVDISVVSGQRSSIVKVEYAQTEWADKAVVDNATGTHFVATEYRSVIAPGGSIRFAVKVSVPESVTAFPFGTDNKFSFKVTPTFAQVNP